MKITIIHGQSHEGNTCMAARELAQKPAMADGRLSPRGDDRLHDRFPLFIRTPISCRGGIVL